MAAAVKASRICWTRTSPLTYGENYLTYGEVERAAVLAHWLFESSILNAWTGTGTIEIDGISYRGVGDLVSIAPVAVEIGEPEKKAQVTIKATSPAMRAILINDPGPLKVSLRQVWSADGGASWHKISRVFRGRMSSPILVAGQYRFEIVSRRADIDRRGDAYWSDVYQQQRVQGDRGFEHARVLSEGMEIRWPP